MLDGKIILVDDNEAVLKTLKMILAREFKTLVGVSVPTLLPALLREGDVDIVLLDMNFVTGRQDGSEGLFWLDRIVGRPDPPQVVLITAFGDIELAVSALKRGAADFVVKPWDNEKLVAILQGAFRRRRKVRTEAASMRRISAEEEKGQVVSLLVGSLLKKYAQAYGKQLPVVTSGGLDKLSGLIRQGDLSALQQTIEFYLFIHGLQIDNIRLHILLISVYPTVLIHQSIKFSFRMISGCSNLYLRTLFRIFCDRQTLRIVDLIQKFIFQTALNVQIRT